MKITTTEIEGCVILSPKVFEDERGFFMETFNAQVFKEVVGVETTFVQDNISCSHFGTVRGLHAQKGNASQAKLVTVLKGRALDIIVDARKNSKTFGKHVKVELSEENKFQVFIPKGCLHGFSALSKEVLLSYKCDEYYNKQEEIAINPLDRSLNIDWEIESDTMIISEKDLQGLSFSAIESLDL